jgi:hypothetical protein
MHPRYTASAAHLHEQSGEIATAAELYVVALHLDPGEEVALELLDHALHPWFALRMPDPRGSVRYRCAGTIEANPAPSAVAATVLEHDVNGL